MLGHEALSLRRGTPFRKRRNRVQECSTGKSSAKIDDGSHAKKTSIRGEAPGMRGVGSAKWTKWEPLLEKRRSPKIIGKPPQKGPALEREKSN